jgi:hypothetical protein
MQSQEHMFGMPENSPPEQRDVNTDARERSQQQESVQQETREKTYGEGYGGGEAPYYEPPSIEEEMTQGQKLRPPRQQPRRRGRGLWVVVGVLVFLMAFGGAINAGVNGLRDNIDRPHLQAVQPPQIFQVGSSPQLIINASGGDVHIHTGLGNQVSVQATGEDSRPWDQKHSGDQVKTKQAATPQGPNNLLTITTQGNRGPFGGNVSLDVTVPVNADIQVNDSSGKVEVQGVTGNVVVNTDSGDVNLTDVQGSVNVHTSSANVDLQNITGAVAVATNSGDIEMNQVNLNGKSQIVSDSGNIHINGVLDPAGAYLMQTNSGDIDLTLPSNAAFVLDEHSTGALNSDFGTGTKVGSGAQATLTITSNSGDITLSKASS